MSKNNRESINRNAGVVAMLLTVLTLTVRLSCTLWTCLRTCWWPDLPWTHHSYWYLEFRLCHALSFTRMLLHIIRITPSSRPWLRSVVPFQLPKPTKPACCQTSLHIGSRQLGNSRTWWFNWKRGRGLSRGGVGASKGQLEGVASACKAIYS